MDQILTPQSGLIFREISPKDNQEIYSIIKNTLEDFNADPKTTVLGDPTLKTMFENYQMPRAVYWVAEENGKVLGGCGIKQLDNYSGNICELQRLFLKPEARGKGIGHTLIKMAISKAKEFNYDGIYLESLSKMASARKLYEKTGFKLLDHPLGSTGHGGCDVLMLLEL